MLPLTAGDRLTLRALLPGVAVPFLYYGIQAAAAPAFPGFSVVSTTASELGSDLSRHPAIFNAGIMVLGVCALVASIGFVRAFRRVGTPPWLAWPAAFAVAMNGVQTLWAGYYPLPDPRHGGHPAFVVAMLALPVLLAAAMWRQGPVRVYLLTNLALLGLMVPLMTGMSGLDTRLYRGLLQRAFTLTIFPPIGVCAFVLRAQLAKPALREG